MQEKKRAYRGRPMRFKFGFGELHVSAKQVNEGSQHSAIAAVTYENSRL